MACFKPIPAYRNRDGSGVFFKHIEDCEEIQLPCGSCIGCRLEKSRQWAVRMMHEAQMHDENSFITLTYRPKDLPDDGSIHIEHYQDFMKRFRARISPRRVRFFHCGEYGEVCRSCKSSRRDCRCEQFWKGLGRPHYHAIIFGFGFPDKLIYKTMDGNRYYTSNFLDDVWGNGYCIVGDVTFNSCAYVARYVTKKMNGEKALDHYWEMDDRTGEMRAITPEYATMSRGSGGTDAIFKGGLGSGWWDKWGAEVEHNDSVVFEGREMKPPRFYENLYDPIEIEAVKGLRYVEAIKRSFDNTPDRLRVREVCKEAQVNLLKRGYEDET